jgi:hypothetical protein
MCMEHLVEGKLAGETEMLEGNLPQRHFVHHKSHLTWPGLEPRPPLCEVGNYRLSDDTAFEGLVLEPEDGENTCPRNVSKNIILRV